jgi:hypothetical protein
LRPHASAGIADGIDIVRRQHSPSADECRIAEAVRQSFDRRQWSRRVERHLDDLECRRNQSRTDGLCLIRRHSAQDGDERRTLEPGAKGSHG